jgi:hypothetical protein
MKTFQIFDRAAPPREPFATFMREISVMSEGYTLIALENFMGRGFYPLQDLRQEVEREMPGFPLVGRDRFDPLRAYYLSRHFDHVYLDLDVQLHQPIPLLPEGQINGPGVLAGNGDAAHGLACWERYKALTRSSLRPASLMFTAGPVRMVPPEFFTHHHAHGDY